MSRVISKSEMVIIASLLEVAGLPVEGLEGEQVDVINSDTGSIRSANLRGKEKIKAVSDCNFIDIDGVYVEAILFVNAKGEFGELYIWKVNDSPLLRIPSDKDEIRKVRKIVK